MGQESDQSNIRAASRGVLEYAMQGSEHPRLEVGPSLCMLDVKMDTCHFVSGQLRHEDIHSRLRSA